MTPFLDVFVEEMPQIPGIQWIYLMLVVQSGSTYFFSYKTSFLNATQQSYINRKYEMAASVAQISAQIAILLLWGNYYLYLAIGIVCPFLKNIFATRQVDRMYPFLKGKAQKLSREETVKIRKNVLALFLYKVCNTIVVTIDTLLISRMFGVIQVAVYSNYHMISSYSDKLFIQGLGAITPSIGNLMTTDDVEKKRQFFSALQMIYYWLSSYLAVGMVVLFNPLIELWLGEEYLFSQSVVIALVISNTLTNFQRPCSLMRDANGLFWHGKLRPLVMTIINIVASIWLGVVMGVIGVVIGTCISKLLTFVWFDPYVVYKHTLHKGLKQYFIKYALYWGLLVVLTVACQTLYDWIGLSGIPGLIVGFVSVSVVVNGVFLLIHYKTKEFDYLKNMISNLLRKRRDGR